jgi:hypothetical protein
MLRVVLLAFILLGCSHSKSTKDGLPQWVQKPEASCPAGNICGVGEGKDLAEASALARAEIAKYFETNILSSFETHLSSQDDTISENTSDYVQEQVDVALKGVSIKESHIKESSTYAYAQLNKAKVHRVYQQKVKEIDASISNSMKSEKLSDLLKAESAYAERSYYEELITLIGYSVFPAPYQRNAITSKIRSITKNIRIKVEGKSERNEIEDTLSATLGKVGIKTSNDNFTHILTYKLNSKELYMKVSGFKKVKVTLSVTILKKGRGNRQSIESTVAKTGRTKENALELATKQALYEIDNKLLSIQF